MKEIQPINNRFELIQFPYDPATLGVISGNTFGFHHGKHLKTYVDNLNRLLPGSGLEGLPITEVVKKAEDGILSNAGQVLNHVMYFEQFGKSNHQPTGRILELINRDFGSFEAFQQEFEQQGASIFGSGWVWLSLDANGHLAITQEPNASNPVSKGLQPLLTFDVWEHAYYLDFQNRRPDYLNALWQIVDWQVIESWL